MTAYSGRAPVDEKQKTLLTFVLAAIGVGIAVLLGQSRAVQSGIQKVISMGQAWWQQSANAQKWAPVIAAAEQQYGIPTGLLARQAYEESGYQTNVINGTQPSSAGALGILQLMPQYFTSVQVPIPFSTGAIEGQIAQAAGYLRQLYNQFGNWGYALAAYNAGPGTVQNVLAGTQTLPAQTQNYVSQILADVPVPGASVPA